MKFEILQRLRGHRVLWMDNQCMYMAQGMNLLKIGGGPKKLLSKITFGTPLERIIAMFRPIRHLMRIGIHHCLPLSGGGLLVVVRKRIYRVNGNRKPVIVMNLPRGNKPASRGVCTTPGGSVFIGEYAQNLRRSMPVVLYRSDDHGKTFKAIHEFAAGDIRHIHFVQWDPVERCLWMGTGDSDSESRLYKSLDNGAHWELIGSGSQLWRAVGIAFRSDAIFWGTDAGFDTGAHPNYIMRLDRRTLQLTKVHQVQGPCHGNAVLGDDTLLVSTGIEGGLNEEDRFSHLWASRDGDSWQEIISFKKDPWPKILQFGVIRFPHGLDSSNRIIYTCMGLTGNGETAYMGRLI